MTETSRDADRLLRDTYQPDHVIPDEWRRPRDAKRRYRSRHRWCRFAWWFLPAIPARTRVRRHLIRTRHWSRVAQLDRQACESNRDLVWRVPLYRRLVMGHPNYAGAR